MSSAVSNKKKAKPNQTRAIAPAARTAPPKFDVDSLTLGDIEDLEAYGVTLGELTQIANLDPTTGQMPPAKVLTAVSWIIGRQSNPDLTPEECRGLTFNQVMELIDGTETPSDAERE